MSKRILLGGILVALVAVAASVRMVRQWTAAPGPGATAAAPPQTRRSSDPDAINLVFVLIDTLRADHLSAYGYERETSPVIDAIARSGVRFERVRSQASWTKASMASLWTGAYPVRTGVLRYKHALPDAVTMPAEILRNAGFRTAGIWRNGWIAGNFGFAQGFDVYYRPAPSRTPEKLTRRNPSAHPLIGTDLDITESAREFLHTYGRERFFLYLHYMDVHQYLYDQDSAVFGPEYADAYDNAIRWTDKNVGMLVELLSTHDLLDRTLLVVASDHGEAFMEHGREGHARGIYREVTEVPLIMRLPGRLPAGIVVEPLVQNVDIWPTLVDLLGLPPLQGAQGTSLVPLIEAAAGKEADDASAVAHRPAFAHMDRTWGRERAEPRPLVSVTEGRYRLIHPVTPPGQDQLFDREADPGEQRDLAPDAPERVAAMIERIETYLDSSESPWGAAAEVEIDAMRLEQLRALGYLRRPGERDATEGEGADRSDAGGEATPPDERLQGLQ
jgi:choline-sulfatase